MTRPRPVIPGRTVMLSRRVTQRQFLLLPSLLVNAILGFCLAVAAMRNGVAIHAFCFLSNHVHIVLTDVEGKLPQFSHWFFEFTAKCINAHRGRWENLWASEQPSVVALEDADAEVRKAVYAIVNPVAGDLVSSAERWPGLVSLPKDVGRKWAFKRPDGFFRADGPVPEAATLTITPLPSLAHLERREYAALLSDRIAEREQELTAERKAAGRRVLGRRAVLRQSPTDGPKTLEPRRGLSPRVATRNKWARVEALRRLKDFTKRYRDAWLRWKAGDRNVFFPYGTYALARFAAVKCLGPP